MEDLLKSARNGENVFVETGTFRGNGIKAAYAAGFTEVHSFEVDGYFVARARAAYPDANIHHCSSAGAEFRNLIHGLKDPAVVFLDAHLMKPGGRIPEDYPLSMELEALISAPIRHTILIDDIRLWSRYGVAYRDVVDSLPGYAISTKRKNSLYPNDLLIAIRGDA
jgi:hypothetical protein